MSREKRLEPHIGTSLVTKFPWRDDSLLETRHKRRKHEVMTARTLSSRQNPQWGEAAPCPTTPLLPCSDDYVVNNDRFLRTVVFSANGEYLVSGDAGGVRVWRVKDGKEMAAMQVNAALCAAVSNDGKWIAVGTVWGEVSVWDAQTHKQVFKQVEDYDVIRAVDFSPDSSRLVAAQWNHKASVWDIATSKQVLQLYHVHDTVVEKDERLSSSDSSVRLLKTNTVVMTAKYSPQGDRIATATGDCVRVYDSIYGHPLMELKVNVTSMFDHGPLWFDNRLLVASDNRIKLLEAFKGTVASEWPVPKIDFGSCIALPKHGRFLAYSTKSTVMFWDISTHNQLSVIQHPQEIWSLAVSPDDRHLAIGGRDGKIIIESLSHINTSTHEQGNQDEQPSTLHNDPPDSTPVGFAHSVTVRVTLSSLTLFTYYRKKF
ncbi:WD40-repeat-containing domain protein [Boletus reticuloceps]|uniref:WD40-repeat-containing domain protein n=1 Tax=Boletus reticuloceps TaxID=495285 RepID=A0A8I2YVR1_9AGAM|nr:WD40-repeat-containing domain protein [Boletus reticuloceps]